MENDWLIEYGGTYKGRFERNFYTTVEDFYKEDLEAYRKKLNNTDLYATLYTYETDDIQNTRLMAPLVFDVDMELHNEGDFRKVVRDTMLILMYLQEDLGVHQDSIQLYFSGSKGFHICIPFEATGMAPTKDLAEKYKIIAQNVNKQTIYKSIDMKIYEKRRLFRIENTINSKTGLYKVPVPISMLRGMTYAQIQAYANSPKEVEWPEPVPTKETKFALDRLMIKNKMRLLKLRHPKTIVPGERKDLLPCVEKILSEGTSQGGRNNTCIAIASSLAQSGIEQEEALQMVFSWNTLNEPPLPDYEVIRTVQSGFQMAHEGRGYGCAFFKDNDYCIGEECKLY